MSAALVIGVMAAALQGLTLWVLTGIRDDARETRALLAALMVRVGEHETFIAALKMSDRIGGNHGKRP